MKDSEIKERSIMLCLTEKCNLSCIYCYEKNKSERTMSSDTAIKIVNSELRNLTEEDAITIDFFGGEPFMAFNVLRETVEYINSAFPSLHPTMFATTNGTLVHDDIQKWLTEQRGCFSCGLSLDGTKKAHDTNRSNSFDRIDLDFFLRTYPGQGVKMTISQATLPTLYESVVFLHDIGFEVNCNLAYGIDWSNSDNCRNLEVELKKLVHYYLEHPSIKPCSILGTKITQLGYSNVSGRKWCGAGTNVHAYDTEGNLYPCQFFLPVTLGQKFKHDAQNIVIPREIPKELEEKKCQDCTVKAVCPTCYGSNYASTGNLYKRDMNLCKLMKITLKARSYYFAYMWKAGKLNYSEEEEQALLRSISIIQDLEL